MTTPRPRHDDTPESNAHEQQQSAVDAIAVLAAWRSTHPEFVVGGNEAGMMLGSDVRAADVAVWLDKAQWYRAHGVATIWIVVPRTRVVTVVDAHGVTDHAKGATLPVPEGLPELHVRVDAFFVQLDGG